jgi:hypothetical protein
MKEAPVATERAMPMKMEWKRMPASSRRHWRSCFWGFGAEDLEGGGIGG